MEALIHLILVLIKISILSCIYATLIFLIIKVISKLKPKSWFAKISKRNIRLWFTIGLLVSIGLFVCMFTYWGNHGIGDSPRIPVGYFRTIQLTNEISYIQGTKYNMGDQIEISDFDIVPNYVCGKTETSFQNYPGEYFVYNLKNNDIVFLKNEIEYNNYANANKLSTSDKFKDFNFYYNQYWNGWRFWLLP